MTNRLPRPRDVAAALDVNPRIAKSWLLGDRSPSVVTLARILAAFPALDARWLVGELADRHRRKHPKD